MYWGRWLISQVKRFCYSAMSHYHATKVVKIFKRNPAKGRYHMHLALEWQRKIRNIDYIKVPPTK